MSFPINNAESLKNKESNPERECEDAHASNAESADQVHLRNSNRSQPAEEAAAAAVLLVEILAAAVVAKPNVDETVSTEYVAFATAVGAIE